MASDDEAAQIARATADVAGQLWRHHVRNKKGRAEYQCTLGDAWWSAFWRRIGA